MVNTKILCVLNCIEDAQLFLCEFSGKHHNWFIVSTHGSVNDYLRAKNIRSVELSSLLTHEFLQESYWEADSEIK